MGASSVSTREHILQLKKENTIRAMAYGVAVRGCLVSARLSSVKRDLLIWQEAY